MRQRVQFVNNQADVLITAFDGGGQPLEVAPTVNLLAFSFATAAATINLHVFYAPGAGAAANNQIEVFNESVTPGAIAGGIWVTVIGGQGGCQRAWRDEATPTTVWTLRATVTGLGADTWDARVEWILGRGVM